MSRDFEEQLINQLILDSSSIDQTAAAVFKAVFAAGRQTEFVRALSAYSSRKDAEIEKTCQLHYEQFAISIDMLLGLRVEAAHLKQLVHTVLQELSYCGELLYDTKVEMHETQKMLFTTQKTVTAISDCLQALHTAQQATLEILDQNFGQALRLMDQLQTSLLPRIDQFPFAAKLHKYIPSQLSTVRSFALEELKLWLSQVREQSPLIGELAFGRAQQRIEKWRELHDGVATPTTVNMGYSVSAAEDLRSASAYVDLVEMEREDAATIINNDQIRVDFAPLLKAVHLFTLMDQRSEFQAQFAEYRRAQAKVLFDMPVNLHDGEASSFAAFLHNVCGFFILEYFIVRKPQKFYSPAHVEGLWETAVGMINGYVLDSLRTLGGTAKDDLAVFMKIKWLQVFFLHAIEVYEIYSVGSMLDTILSLFYRYVDASKNEALHLIREAAASGCISPLPITSSGAAARIRRTFSFLADDSSLESSAYFPFSEYVPTIYNHICDFVTNFYVFLEGVPQHSSELDDIAKKNCIMLIEESVRVYRDRASAASLEELLQMISDFDAIARACDDLSILITRCRARSRASPVRITCQDSCSTAVNQVMQRILETLKKELEEMFNRNRFNPTPLRVSTQPSVLVKEFVQIYEQKIGRHEKQLPEDIARRLALDLSVCLTEELLEYLKGKAISELNMNFVENLALDIPVVQSFAEQKIGNALETTPQFLELQQLVGLIRADQPHEFLDPIVRAQKYPNLRPTALTKALQKIKEPVEKRQTCEDLMLLLQ